ncbi:MAG: [protein-PII] uridylyltransferase [Corynebacterium sp.]|uniref:[protein-PII] uridylyltransferase n=1 Tax=Corynebacterium sp. TaxID=1720 RepID=UPI0026DBF13F|nr:[protein-PII] uridylyltransferase [Corynebacterium sp.]MDO4762716.1 [protein-PII] uridylyltransferase [Corynebacterium sp.]
MHRIRAQAYANARALIETLPLPPGCALAATGSFARRELLPTSDLDLVLIHPPQMDMDDPAMRELVDALWYPLWDHTMRLDHAVRTPQQCADLVESDPVSALAMLELRHVRGVEELTAQARDAVLRRWRVHLSKNFNDVVDVAIARWRRSGSVVAMTRPDLKHGRGGLRDHEFLRALALGNLVDIPDLSQQRNLLIDARTLLHHYAGRPREVLDPEFAIDVAEQLGFSDRYELARAVAKASRSIDEALTHALNQCRNVLPRPSGLKHMHRRPLDVDVVDGGGEITLSRNPDLSDPGLVLRVAAASARTGLPIRPSVWTQLAQVPPLPATRWSTSAASDFFALLSSPEHTARVIIELDEHGLFVPMVPVWEHIRGLMPREPVHIRTIDRHNLAVVELCARDSVRVERPDLLLLAALFHDMGKGYSRPHEEVGAEMVAEMATTLRLSAQDTTVVEALVRHHTLIPRLVKHRDIEDDQSVVTELLDALGYNLLTLNLMEALIPADAQATGPGVWTPQLKSGLGYLCARARTMLTRNTPQAPQVRFGGELALYPTIGAHATVFWAGSYMRESVRVLALIAAKGWNITSAAFVYRDGIVSAELKVYNTLGTAFNESEFIQGYKSGVYSALPTIEPGACATFWFGDVLEVRTTDRKAALGTLIGVLPELEWLKIHTPGATMIAQCKLAAGYDRAKVERDVTRVLTTG